MADDIHINTGATFQQQFTGRAPATGTVDASARTPVAQQRDNQTPFTYSHRAPFTYRSPVVNQTPYIAAAQQSYPYIAAGQQPYIANRQNAYPYIAVGQTPFTYQHRQPGTYRNPVAGQQPYIADGRNPFTYQHRSPFTYAYRNPFPYTHREPFPYTHRNPFPYTHREPFPYTHQNPFTYAYQQPYPYIANATGNATGTTESRSPFSWFDSITSVYASDSDSAYENNANADARIRVYCRYQTVPAGGRLEAYIQTFGLDSSSHSSATRCFYIPAATHTVATGGYTVRFTQTAAAESGTYGPTNLDGDDNASTITGVASAVPTNVTTKYFEWEVTSESEPISDDEELADFTLNLIFEHASLPTLTYACDWSLKAETDADSGE